MKILLNHHVLFSVSTAVPESQASATLKLHEDLMSVLHGEILRCIRQVEVLMAGRARETTAVRDLSGKVEVGAVIFSY